ncbi:response regulator [Pseudolysinimonas sp.]|jgi:DNA-binding NarL/FixJ family response regulator|uniref:response regulator n=1 Tax=Pseudolysinimonas sp. TaxID=2680009 RepID=UPI00378358BB
MTSAIRILLVDDQELVRTGFRVILGSVPGLEVVGEASDGARAIELARELRPDVICMDVQMPVLDGLDATRRIVADPEATGTVLVLTTFDDDDSLFRALDAGASGFLLKTASPEQLVDAVRVLAAGDALLAPEVTRRVIERFGGVTAAPRAAELDALTEREEEVFRLVARGLSNAEIATGLHVGEATVKTHVSSILLKLGVRDRVQAVVRAYETGFAVPGA